MLSSRSFNVLRLVQAPWHVGRSSTLRRLSSAVQAKKDEPVVIEASKKNIDQSPWKMNFLVKLVRGRWYPDAMAQLKFSPKGKSGEVGAILQRAANVAKIYHQTIPEELFVKEIFVTKGFAQKKMRIMGRGRTGFGYKRRTHVRVKLEKIDFEKMIGECKSYSQKQKWVKRHELVKSMIAERGANETEEQGEEQPQAENKDTA